MYADPIDIARAVETGAAWLDANAPDWPAKVDPDRIRVSDPCDCPLGQVYGNFYSAPKLTFGAENYGFDASSREAFDQLDAEWARLINARRNVAVIADGVDFDIECGVCGGRERNVATDPLEARRVADQHVCDEGSS